MNLKKAYYYLYYKLYNLGVSISDDVLNEWKPVITILVLQVLLIVEVYVWYSIAAKKAIVLVNPVLSFVPLIVVIGFSNYNFFLRQGKWKSYVDEFSHYDKQKKAVGRIIVFFIIALVTASIVFCFYRLSKIGGYTGR